MTTKFALTYLEIPIVKHCNLNCRYCSHMANLEDEHFVDRASFLRDIERMKEFFDEIPTIRLLGGEPLLHPDINSLVNCVRNFYPHADIKIATNGILLLSIDDVILEGFRENKVIVDITVYPPIEGSIEKIKERLLRHGVYFYFSEPVLFFQRRLLREPFSNKTTSWQTCGTRNCVVLVDGKLSSCYAPHLVGIAKEKFNKEFHMEDSILNIHDKHIDRETIIRFLNMPHDSCSYCGVPEKVSWEFNKKDADISDWYVNLPIKRGYL